MPVAKLKSLLLSLITRKDEELAKAHAKIAQLKADVAAAKEEIAKLTEDQAGLNQLVLDVEALVADTENLDTNPTPIADEFVQAVIDADDVQTPETVEQAATLGTDEPTSSAVLESALEAVIAEITAEEAAEEEE